MRRLILLLALFCLALPAFAQTPSLLQVKNDLDWIPNFFGLSGIVSGNTMVDQLPNPVGAHNTLVELLAVDDTASPPTLTDSLGLTWTRNAQCKDTTNGEDTLIYSANTGTSSGLDTITTTYHAASNFTGSPALAEFSFVGSIDGAAVCAFANSTTVAAGSHTPAQSGDLVVQFAWNDWLGTIGSGGCIGVHYTHGSQANISWQKFIDGRTWCFGAQWGVYNSTAALNPTFSVSTAGYNTVAAFFSPSSSGTAQPAGVRVLAQQNVPIMSSGAFASTAPTAYFPCPPSTDTMVAEWAGPGTGSTYDMTAVADSSGANTWASNHAEVCDVNGFTCLHNYHTDAATVTDAQAITPTLKASSDDTIHLFCLSGAASSSLDATATATGNQTSAGNLSLVSVTPNVPTDVVLLSGSQTFNTTRSFTGTGQQYAGCFYSPENISLDGCAANNPWGVYYDATTGAVSWTGVMESGTTAVGNWSAEADAYKPPSATVVRHRAVIQ